MEGTREHHVYARLRKTNIWNVKKKKDMSVKGGLLREVTSRSGENDSGVL
jgi:hypothetical protein